MRGPTQAPTDNVCEGVLAYNVKRVRCKIPGHIRAGAAALTGPTADPARHGILQLQTSNQSPRTCHCGMLIDFLPVHMCDVMLPPHTGAQSSATTLTPCTRSYLGVAQANTTQPPIFVSQRINDGTLYYRRLQDVLLDHG